MEKNVSKKIYDYYQKFKREFNDRFENNRKDPEEIARLVEQIITSPDPRLRYQPDATSRQLVLLRRLLPFSFFSKLIFKRIGDTIKPSPKRTVSDK